MPAVLSQDVLRSWRQCVGGSEWWQNHVCEEVLPGTKLRSADVYLHAYLKDHCYNLTERGFFLILSHVLTTYYN